MDRPKVVISTLSTYERHGWICFDLVVGLLTALQSPKYQVAWMPAHKVDPVMAARNLAGKKFLKESDAEWLCMVDNDMAPPLGTDFLSCLDEANEHHDIIVPMFHLWQEVNCFPALCWEPKEQRNNLCLNKEETKQFLARKFVELNSCGSGLIFIRRRVLEAMPYPWFRRIYDEDGRLKDSEDTLFTREAVQRGFRVWGYTQYCVGHYHTVNIAHIPPPEKVITKESYGIEEETETIAHA